MSARFASLEEVVQHPDFPAVDVALRRGRHIDREDGDWYAFITDAQEYLEPFYHRYGCELVTQSDGYFYLLPTGDKLSRRHLSAGEMLVGQTLALQYLDPATVQSGGLLARNQLLTRLEGLIGDQPLARVLEPRRKRFDDERVMHELIRRRIAEAIRRLASLGFIELLEQDRLRLRAPLLRFADPVRGLQDICVALERLVSRGEVVDLGEADEAVGDDDTGTAGDESENEAENEAEDGVEDGVEGDEGEDESEGDEGEDESEGDGSDDGGRDKNTEVEP